MIELGAYLTGGGETYVHVDEGAAERTDDVDVPARDESGAIGPADGDPDVEATSSPKRLTDGDGAKAATDVGETAAVGPVVALAIRLVSELDMDERSSRKDWYPSTRRLSTAPGRLAGSPRDDGIVIVAEVV